MQYIVLKKLKKRNMTKNIFKKRGFFIEIICVFNTLALLL